MPRWFEDEQTTRNRRIVRNWLIIATVCFLITAVNIYGFYRDIDAMKYRAQVAVDAEIMAWRLDELRLNMERRNMRNGYVFPLWGTAVTDLTLDYEAVVDARNRAVLLAKLDKSSVAYQSGMADLRGILNDITIDAVGYAMWRSVFLYLGVACVIALLVHLWKVNEKRRKS